MDNWVPECLAQGPKCLPQKMVAHFDEIPIKSCLQQAYSVFSRPTLLLQISYVCSAAPAPIPIVMAPLFSANSHYFNSESQHWHIVSPRKELLSAKIEKTRPCTTVRDSEDILEQSPFQKYSTCWVFLALYFAFAHLTHGNIIFDTLEQSFF